METSEDKGRQAKTRGDKTLGKVDTPSNTGTHMGRQWEKTLGNKETRPWEGGQTRHTYGGDSGRQGETSGDKTRGKADTPSNTQAHMWGDSGRQWETRGDKADKGRQGETRRTHHPTQAHIQWETRGDKTFGKGTPSNTGAHAGRQYRGRQWETRGRRIL